MKKGLHVVLLLILLAMLGSVGAMTVTLGGPTGTQTTSTINFGCTATADTGETLSSLTLWHNIDGTFKANETTTSPTSGTEYTFSIPNVPNGNYEWNCEASNSTDTFLATANNTFTVSVPTNNAPVWTAIPTQTWPETEPKTLILSDYFTDPDGDTLTYSGTTTASVTISIAGATATLTPQNWHGTGSVTFTANDGKGVTNSTSADINVTHANRPPYNKTEYMGNVTWTQNEEERVELDDYFADYEGDTLTYRVIFSSGTTHHINITIDNSTAEAILIPETDWKGIERVIFKAYDGQGGSLDSNEVTLTVKAGEKVNHAPQIRTRSPLMNPVLTVGSSQKFTIEPEDQDLDDLTIKWFINVDEQIASRGKQNYTFLGISEGTYEILATVSDGEFSDSENWTVKVQRVAGTTPQQPEVNQTAQEPVDVCGNGQVNVGETCATCPEDVPCDLGYECKNDVCTKEVKTSNLKLMLIVGGGFIIFAAATILTYRLYKKRALFGGWKPEYTGDTTNVKIAVKPREETQPTIEKKEVLHRLDPKKSRVNEILLKHYIENNLKRGETIEKIREKLKKVGWSDEKIDEVYKAVELDETFRK